MTPKKKTGHQKQNFREGLFMPGNFIDFEYIIVGGFSQPEELENHVRSWTISSKTSRKMDPCGHTPACEGEMEQTFPWRTGYWQPKSPMNMLYLPTHPTLALASAREIYSTCFYMNRKRMKNRCYGLRGFPSRDTKRLRLVADLQHPLLIAGIQ